MLRELQTFLLTALVGMQQDKMVPECTLFAACRLVFPHKRPTEAELLEAINGMDTQGWIIGENHDLLGRRWMLTPTGRGLARQLQ